MKVIDYLAEELKSAEPVFDYLSEELRREEERAAAIRNKRATGLFHKFYPRTTASIGGVRGLTRWLATEKDLPARAARVFNNENHRLVNDFGSGEPGSEFDVVGKSDLMGVICEAC